ncbi:MAG: DUF4160 domain-containing protein [Solirubrobacterales bacterium]|nr:DUF4160 domain-containing protein [Solirubrobacterales bacterium]
MPELCRFRGIVFLMYADEGVHQVGHFHVRYAEYRASVAFDGSVLAGSLPASQLKLVRQWAARHQVELAANWVRAREGQRLERIDPLA